MASAIHRAVDEATGDGGHGIGHHAERDSLGIGDGVGLATTGAEHIAAVVVMAAAGQGHQDVFAHLAAVDGHRGRASVRGESLGDLYALACISAFCVRHRRKLRERAHRAKLAAAVDAVFHLSAVHGDGGVSLDQARCFVVCDSFAAAIDAAFDDHLRRGHTACEQ